MSEPASQNNSTSTAELLPAVIPSGPAPLPSIVEAMQPSSAPTWASWPLTTPADRIAAYNALHGKSQALVDTMRKPIKVRGIVAHYWEGVDEETGLVENVVRTIFIGPAGELYSCSSQGVQHCIRDLLPALGPGPWDPPVELMLDDDTTSKKRRVFKLVVVLAPHTTLPAPAKERKNAKG